MSEDISELPEPQRRAHAELQEIEGIVDYMLFPRLYEQFSYRLVSLTDGNFALAVIKQN